MYVKLFSLIFNNNILYIMCSFKELQLNSRTFSKHAFTYCIVLVVTVVIETHSLIRELILICAIRKTKQK